MTAVTDRARHFEPGPMELLFEIALMLLPLIGRCVEVSGGEPVAQHGNRLGEAGDRRLVIADVAKQWSRLGDAERARLGAGWKPAVAEFTVEYVDAVEAQDARLGAYEQRQYEVSMALIWHRHVERLRADATQPR